MTFTWSHAFCLGLILSAAGTGHLPAAQTNESPANAVSAWPRVIPCRIQDGANPDLLVMTLGNIQTPLADGTFDPIKDTVTLNDGTVKTNYYRDTLGVKYYQPLDKSHFPLPPSGWCTWYYYYNRIDAEEVRRNAEWLAANLKDYGARYVQIDDGWQGTGAKGSARNWDAINTNRFPNGMAAVAQHIKSLGLEPGLWIAPHGQNNDTVVSNNPGVFLLCPDGTTASDTWEGRFLIDPSTGAATNYLHQLFTKLSGWGYDYFKIDGQPIVVDEYAAKQQFMHAPGADGTELYRRTVRAIRDAIGPDRYLLGCWGTPLQGAGIMNGSRTGGDIVLGWGGFQVALRPTLEYYYLHNIVWYSDPDVVLVRSPLTLDQAQTWATLAGLTGQGLMSSDRLMDLGEDRVELLRRIYPATDIRPLDLFPASRNKRIWDLKVNQLNRHYDVVGVFNFDPEKTDQVVLNWQELGLPDDQLVHVYDFWHHEYLGTWKNGMAVPLAATSCRVLTLLPDNGRIQLLSTSRHITQGPVDLTRLTTDAAGTGFTGSSTVVKNDPYRLTFAFPRGTNYAAIKATVRSGWHHLPVKISNHQGWAVVEFTSPKTGPVDWSVQFAPDKTYDFPPSAPVSPYVQRIGLSGVNVYWQEQYYLNSGYEVWLDGALLGRTPENHFTIRRLDPHADHKIQVRTVWENGHTSPPSAPISFTLAALLPDELSLTSVEPAQASGNWESYEIEGLLPAPAWTVAGRTFERGLNGFAQGERTYALQGFYDQFKVQVGIDDHSGTNAAAQFTVIGDGRELWSSAKLKRGDAPQSIAVPISGVQQLILKTQPVEGQDDSAEVDWLEPVLSRTKP